MGCSDAPCESRGCGHDYGHKGPHTWQEQSILGYAGVADAIARNHFRAAINNLQYNVHQCAVEHGWWEGERQLPELIALMHSELSEALEAWREGDDVTKVDHQYNWDDQGEPQPTKPVGVASEFADVIIRILDACEKWNIPIAEALLQKHAYNLTREFRHGGKKA